MRIIGIAKETNGNKLGHLIAVDGMLLQNGHY
jgi:hypothetical protein